MRGRPLGGRKSAVETSRLITGAPALRRCHLRASACARDTHDRVFASVRAFSGSSGPPVAGRIVGVAGLTAAVCAAAVVVSDPDDVERMMQQARDFVAGVTSTDKKAASNGDVPAATPVAAAPAEAAAAPPAVVESAKPPTTEDAVQQTTEDDATSEADADEAENLRIQIRHVVAELQERTKWEVSEKQ